MYKPRKYGGYKRGYSKGFGMKRYTKYPKGYNNKFRRGYNSIRRFPKNVLTGFARDMEKKYYDKTWCIGSQFNNTGMVVDKETKRYNGVMWTSHDTFRYRMDEGNIVQSGMTGDIVKGLVTGTTTESRIGNKVNAKYIKGAITFTAAVSHEDDNYEWNNQGGEKVPKMDLGNAIPPNVYMRTTIRWCVVKDNQVNSIATTVRWKDVFTSSETGGNGVHSELNVKNMGRFVVLRDETFELYADKPQSTRKFFLNETELGRIRYNGPDVFALTNIGIYIVFAAYTVGTAANSNTMKTILPLAMGHSRLCFTDA